LQSKVRNWARTFSILPPSAILRSQIVVRLDFFLYTQVEINPFSSKIGAITSPTDKSFTNKGEVSSRYVSSILVKGSPSTATGGHPSSTSKENFNSTVTNCNVALLVINNCESQFRCGERLAQPTADTVDSAQRPIDSERYWPSMMRFSSSSTWGNLIPAGESSVAGQFSTIPPDSS